MRKKTRETGYNPSDIKLLRKIFSNQKTKILYFLKHRKPSSIYSLAKMLNRDFKSVYHELKLLERFGFVEFHAEKKGKREGMRPILKINELIIKMSV